MHNILLGKKFSIDGTHLDIPSSFEAQSPENYHSNFSQARPLPGGEEEEEDRILIFLTACMKDHGWSSLHPSEAQPTLPTTVVCFTKHTHIVVAVDTFGCHGIISYGVQDCQSHSYSYYVKVSHKRSGSNSKLSSQSVFWRFFGNAGKSQCLATLRPSLSMRSGVVAQMVVASKHANAP